MRIAGTLILCSFLLSALARLREPEYLLYKEFLREVRNGSIVSAELDQFSQIKGVRMFAGKEVAYKSYAGTGDANDPILTDLLKASGVHVSIGKKDDRYGFGLETISTLLMIWAIPIGILSYVLRVWKELNQLKKSHQKAQVELMQHGE